MRGLRREALPKEVERLLTNKYHSQMYWNLLHKSILRGKLQVVEFLMEQSRVNIQSTIRISESITDKVGQVFDTFILDLALH